MNKSLQKSIAHRKPVFGVGINDADYITNPRVDGKLVMCQFYRTWAKMLEICYSIKWQAKYPTYIGCTVCDEWLTFSNFKEWMMGQDWHGNALGKNIINHGNKVYGPDTCVFVPQKINKLLNTNKSTRGNMPLGVFQPGKRFQARVKIDGKLTHIGTFDSPDEASVAFNAAKAANIRRIATEQTDPRIATALIKHARLYEKGEIQ